MNLPYGKPETHQVQGGKCVGLVFQNLNVYGFDNPMDHQKTFFNYPLTIFAQLVRKIFQRSGSSRLCILRNFEGAVSRGEMLLVLGRPGSGCTTLLKTLAGDTYGLHVDPSTLISYQGIFIARIQLIDCADSATDIGTPMTDVRKRCRGEYTYLSESDTHFAHLTVAQTLKFASQARTSSHPSSGDDRLYVARKSVDDTVKALSLAHTLDTKVGNHFVRGISGGERKRTSIAEVLVGTSRLQCWDNSIRGLDSANALRFIETLRSSAKEGQTAVIATLYQASEDIYDCFDKIILLYEGHEIFFGATNAAKLYFTDLGFDCPDRSTTADFLCSITNPLERIVRKGCEDNVPRSASEFEKIWERSRERDQLVADIQIHQQKDADDRIDPQLQQQQVDSNSQRSSTPYRLTFPAEIGLCLHRSFQRLFQDLTPPVSGIVGNAIISIILGSMFYNMPDDTSSFFGRGVLLFFTILTNTLLASFEGVQLWEHRPIVEKQHQFAFYHRSAEAVASMLCDLPNKILLTAGFNIPFYFLANMRRTPAAFLTFYLFAFVSLLTGSMLYRTIGAMSRTLTASIAPGSDFILLLVIYTGFVLPIPSMHPWLRWFGYINPVGYAFESLMINEFDGRQFPCVSFIPEGLSYVEAMPNQKMCSVTGATAGANFVDGASYLSTTFQYYPEHLWRNLGVLFAFMVFLCCLYLLATECLSTQRPRGEVLLFRQGQSLKASGLEDEEAQQNEMGVSRFSQGGAVQTSLQRLERKGTEAATFVWDNLSYQIKTGKGWVKLLDDIEGWVEPGTVTALMGESGAGKTTLLNVLANRTSIGVISGEKLVDARFQNAGFARKVGYAQQQDMATPTATVKETLIFNARLRQSSEYSDVDKLAYVDEVIATLDLCELADAVIGDFGEGLNIEQRKRLTIGIELAARPELLLFLDEPTSGLDSNTAWSICKLLRRLADSGQAILCTIHQPSGTAFEMFDRLLFIQNGRTVYFGDIGSGSLTVIDYFSRQGVPECASKANPAEWLLTVTDRSADAVVPIDWPQVWATSAERLQIKKSLLERKIKLRAPASDLSQPRSRTKYASSYFRQLYYVTRRNFEQDWRSPSYLHSKLFLALGAVSSPYYHAPCGSNIPHRALLTACPSTCLLIVFKGFKIRSSPFFYFSPYTVVLSNW